MEKYPKPIGGEHWFDINIFDIDINNFKDSKYTLLNGGQSALNFIVRKLALREEESILMPAYLCPTIIENFDRNKVNYSFYKVKADLSIDLEDLEGKLTDNKVKAVFIINYFGFYHEDNTISFLKSIKERGIIVIEDSVQMLWFSAQKFIGDYVFNSYRKFLPIDGSIVISNNAYEYPAVNDEYYQYMNNARMKITAFVKFGLGEPEDFIEIFNKAHEAYGKSVNIDGMSEISRYLLNKVNFEYIGRIRRQNYNYLYDQLSRHTDIKILFDKELIRDNIPIGFPILIKDRNNVRTTLRNKAIYCPAHWPILEERWVKDYPVSIHLASNILTLPIDQRYDFSDMDRLINELTGIFNTSS